ncbi:MAG: hypothetical protein KKH94_12870 [Candidatus Omnitrophica bacterium]|nr:hypothetical protein [Candidatus Omnitrophota bacterium]
MNASCTALDLFVQEAMFLDNLPVRNAIGARLTKFDYFPKVLIGAFLNNDCGDKEREFLQRQRDDYVRTVNAVADHFKQNLASSIKMRLVTYG